LTTNDDANLRSQPLTGSNAVHLQISGPIHLTKDENEMFHIEFREAEAEERQARFRAEAEARHRWQPPRRPFRQRAGESIVRFGRQVGGDAMSDPLPDTMSHRAWQG
jgi:hypothetical protein